MRWGKQGSDAGHVPEQVCWHVGSNASADAAYNCYKIMAGDMGLGKPWQEQGKEEPDSLVEQMRYAIDKARDSFGTAKKWGTCGG